MKIHLEPTERIVDVVAGEPHEKASVPGRVWQGHTESGIEISVIITRLSCRTDADQSDFEATLHPQPPTVMSLEAFPKRLVL